MRKVRSFLCVTTAAVLTAGVAIAESPYANNTSYHYAGVTGDGPTTTTYLSVAVDNVEAIGNLAYIEHFVQPAPADGATFAVTYALTTGLSAAGVDLDHGLLFLAVQPVADDLTIEQPGTVGLMSTVALGAPDDALGDWSTELDAVLMTAETGVVVIGSTYQAAAFYPGQHVVTPNNFHPALFEATVADPAFLIDAKQARIASGSGWNIDLLGDSAS